MGKTYTRAPVYYMKYQKCIHRSDDLPKVKVARIVYAYHVDPEHCVENSLLNIAHKTQSYIRIHDCIAPGEYFGDYSKKPQRRNLSVHRGVGREWKDIRTRKYRAIAKREICKQYLILQDYDYTLTSEMTQDIWNRW